MGEMRGNGFSPPPTTPGPFPKIMVAPFFLSKIALDLVEFATATRPFAATNFEGSRSVRLLENIYISLKVVWVTPPLDAYSLSTRSSYYILFTLLFKRFVNK